jgi:alginate O-acetyltransferase complex protein AlgI
LLLAASIFFYSWGAPRFIFVLLGTTFLDFHLVQAMHNSSSQKRRKYILALSVCMNLGLLFYFKYCNFFVENLNVLLGSFSVRPMGVLNVILPIGISFYTFESLTYVIDVYRRVHAPLNNFWNYQLYIILFPKLIAGPIIRYHEIADQIANREWNDNIQNKISGFVRFTIGLAKKVFLANTLGAYSDTFFADPANASLNSWLAVLCYTFQIYYDFSGYSDMAIGLGRMFGFTFPENFNNPYTSGSITEFWRRWHITLGRWMKNYLYIPLGGNRVNSATRLYFNLWVVFLISGLWHGAAFTFILWGMYHGAFLVLERVFLARWLHKAGAVFSTLFTFLLVALGWVIFRADTVTQAIVVYKRLFTFKLPATPPVIYDMQFVFYFLLAITFSFITAWAPGKKIQQQLFFLKPTPLQSLGYSFISCIFIILAVACISSTGFNPFIYFRF